MKYPLPILEFKDARGLDAHEFATFRLGTKLAKTLKRGQRVMLAHGSDAIGTAIVSKVDVGTARDMVTRHALASHLELDGDRDLQAAIERRLTSLRRLYGPIMFNEDRTLSVIYLRRTRRR